MNESGCHCTVGWVVSVAWCTRVNVPTNKIGKTIKTVHFVKDPSLCSRISRDDQSRDFWKGLLGKGNGPSVLKSSDTRPSVPGHATRDTCR